MTVRLLPSALQVGFDHLADQVAPRITNRLLIHLVKFSGADAKFDSIPGMGSKP